MPRFESTSSRARAFELCLKNRSIASLCKDCDDSIVSGRSSAFFRCPVFDSFTQHFIQKNWGKRNPRPFFSSEIDEQVEINAHYRGYLKKQKADILAFKRDENLIIPDKINYDSLSGLSNEVKAKFKEIRPKTMGQALRIDGITPAAVYILLSHVKRKSIKHIA